MGMIYGTPGPIAMVGLIESKLSIDSAHCHLMAVINYSSSFQNSLMAASAAAAYCFQVYYCHENHLFHPAKGAPQKRDDLPRKRGTLLVPLLRCPPSILMGNGGGTPPPPSLFTGAHFGFHLITEWSAGPFIHLLSHLCPKIAFNRTTGRSVNLKM